jgi:hypothetical protein
MQTIQWPKLEFETAKVYIADYHSSGLPHVITAHVTLIIPIT